MLNQRVGTEVHFSSDEMEHPRWNRICRNYLSYTRATVRALEANSGEATAESHYGPAPECESIGGSAAEFELKSPHEGAHWKEAPPQIRSPIEFWFDFLAVESPSRGLSGRLSLRTSCSEPRPTTEA